MDLAQVSSFVSRSAVDHLPPTVRIRQPRFPDGFQGVIFCLNSSDGTIEEGANNFLRSELGFKGVSSSNHPQWRETYRFQ
jgi:hypothetical protein